MTDDEFSEKRERRKVLWIVFYVCWFSLWRGCPIVAVSMDERLQGIMKELSFDKAFLLHVDEEQLGRKVYRALVSAGKQREDIRERILAYKDGNRRKLERMGVFLKEYLEKELSE